MDSSSIQRRTSSFCQITTNIKSTTVKKEDSFQRNQYHRVSNVSNQDGLFTATCRHFWIVSERGTTYVLHHRLRHAAAAGSQSLSITGFACSEEGSFFTLHERIGRLGSQRLTYHTDGVCDVFTPRGLSPGGGVSVKKVPFGVTVRRMDFINDTSVSTEEHPLYVLVSSNQNRHNNDKHNDNDTGSHDSIFTRPLNP